MLNEAIMISEEDEYFSEPVRIEVDDDYYLHLVYTDNQITKYVKLNRDMTCSRTPEDLNSGTGNYYPNIGLDSNGFVHVVWDNGAKTYLTNSKTYKSGGQFTEQTTHTIDLARYLFGDVASVYAVAVRDRKERPDFFTIEDASMGQMAG